MLPIVLVSLRRLPGGALPLTAALLFWLCAPVPARAQGSARSLDLDPSVRAAGMGQASNAVFWDGGNPWANPALLGYQTGLRYEWGKTQLVPDFSDDIFFETEVVKAGGGGVGLFAAGQPIGLGGLRLDYGLSEWIDDQGNPIGTFRSWEEIESWGFGVSLMGLAETVARRRAGVWSRVADVSFGMAWKDVEVRLRPGFESGAEARDLGVLARVTPLPAATPADLDLAFGWSNLSYEAGDVLGSRPSEHTRYGFAARATLASAPPLDGWMEAEGWFWRGFRPLLTVGVAWDHARVEGELSSYETDGSGLEVTLFRVGSIRYGSYEDEDGGIEGRTWGWSLGLPIGRVAGARYDWATIPQAAGLSEVEREGFSVWLDPLALWRETGGEDAGPGWASRAR